MDQILIGKGERPVCLLAKYGNCHGLITGAHRHRQDSWLYSSFLLWLLAELFENRPEVGDLDKPKLVVFSDEAHLLFDDAQPALRQRVEQVVRIIRS